MTETEARGRQSGQATLLSSIKLEIQLVPGQLPSPRFDSHAPQRRHLEATTWPRTVPLALHSCNRSRGRIHSLSNGREAKKSRRRTRSLTK